MARTRIKICGVLSSDMALHAAEAGADAVGLVFYPPSARHVDTVLAREIARALPPFVSCVALFVDADAAQVRAVLDTVQPDLLQFHGQETPEYCRQFGRAYVKAIRVHPGLDLLQYAARFADAKALLLDACVAGVAGGSGKGFDWGLIPAGIGLPLILSGGLHKDNVGEAVRRVNPWAVDVSSGVESARGIKDKQKIMQFITEVDHAQR